MTWVYVAGLILLLVPPAAAENNVCFHPLPVSEVESVLRDWLVKEGFTVGEPAGDRDRVRLKAERMGTPLAITLTPNSPLGSRMEVLPGEGTVGEPRLCDQFAAYLAGYLDRPAGRREPDAAKAAAAVPAAVLSRINATVCIEGHEGGAVSQQSGVIVDAEGIILCTTHALTEDETIQVSFHDGRKLPGRLLKIDPLRDLALIHVGARLAAAVPLRQGRNLLENEEIVYAVGCPQNQPGTINPGVVDGPPRRAEEMPYWQARMEVHPGSSGSPVFDGSGRIVGIVKGRFRGTNSIAFLIPLETVAEFLNQR